MKKNFLKQTARFLFLALAVMPIASMAQNTTTEQKPNPDKEFYLRPSYWVPYDQRGINQFESNKTPDPIPFEGIRVRLGAGFTMQYQALKHSNTATNNTVAWNGTNGGTKLYPLQPGFSTAQANQFLDVQLAEGVRMNVTSYLSARHHNETWVKGGYIQIDKVPFLKSALLDNIMKIATIKVGHMEVNYGDAHFRRTDGGNALMNPFAENYIVDAFATEIGGEVYLQKNGLFGMLGVSNGMIKGHVDSTYPTKASDGITYIDANTNRNPSVYLKAGIDKQVTEKVRVRVSGSMYTNSSQAGSGLTLYGGDRTGSNYWMVMEAQNIKDKATGAIVKNSYDASAFSGRYNPGFSKKITAYMFNGFLKAGGLEFFGTYETAKGRSKTETTERNMTQLAGDLIYRFGKTENLFIGARLNQAKFDLVGVTQEASINRTAIAAGWFLTKNVLMKGEYVTQKYNDFPAANILNGGKFNGVVIEAVVGF
jgi:hypothetical protein